MLTCQKMSQSTPRVETNAGNGYDVRSGKFTAPESGIYVFHTQLHMTNLTVL